VIAEIIRGGGGDQGNEPKVKFLVRLRNQGQSLVFSVPSRLRNELAFKSGDYVQVWREGNVVCVLKIDLSRLAEVRRANGQPAAENEGGWAMPENANPGLWVLSITLNFETGECDFEFPPSYVVALGMLESAREMLMMRTVRPMMAPQVAPAGPVRLVMPGRSWERE
jgi:hypothetical protein